MNLLLTMLLMMAGIPAGMPGTWQGQARPVNDFLAGKPIPVVLNIAADGRAAGSVGTAKMVDSKFRPRAWSEWKAMNHYEYRVDFRLEGELAPGVERGGARILLNWREDRWEGWVVTEGSLFGGRTSIQVHAAEGPQTLMAPLH